MAKRKTFYIHLALVATFNLIGALYPEPTPMEEVMNLKASIEYSSLDNDTISKTIRCETNADSTKIITITELILSTSVPCDFQEANLALASVDIWSEGPKMITDTERSNLNISGQIRPDNHLSSHLAISWKSPITYPGCSYNCTAKGVNVGGYPASESKNIADGWLSRDDMGDLSYMNAIEAQLQSVANRFPGDACNCTDINYKLNSLEERVNDQSLHDMVSSLKEITSNLSKELQRQTKSLSFVMKWLIDTSRKFDVSGLMDGKVYLLSKTRAKFDIDAADQTCQGAGGYLVELDSDAEHSFVLEFIKTIGGSGKFFIGTNDIAKEGSFVHRTSKKPLTLDKWAVGEPNGTDEDCMELYSSGEFNDTECWALGRYICEVPFPPGV